MYLVIEVGRDLKFDVVAATTDAVEDKGVIRVQHWLSVDADKHILFEQLPTALRTASSLFDADSVVIYCRIRDDVEAEDFSWPLFQLDCSDAARVTPIVLDDLPSFTSHGTCPTVKCSIPEP